MDEVAQILDIEVVKEEKTEIVSTTTTEIVVPESTVDQDLKSARDTYYQIIGIGKTALDGAMRVANLSEHPRAFEVVGTLLKNLADVNKQLIELAALNKKDEKPAVQSVTNNVQFIGTSADLNKMIADKLNEVT